IGKKLYLRAHENQPSWRDIEAVCGVIDDQLRARRIKRAAHDCGTIGSVAPLQDARREEMAAIREKERPAMPFFTLRIESRDWSRRPTVLRYLVDLPENIGREENGSVAPPASAASSLYVADRLDRPSIGCDLLQLVVCKEGN